MYANSNYVLLAAVIERVTGTSFPEYMRSEVFEPLGMRRTTAKESDARLWNSSSAHEWQWGRVRVSPSRFLGWHGSSLVKASVSDMAAYIRALLDPGPARGDALPLPDRWWDSLEPKYDLGWEVLNEAQWLSGDLVLQHTGKLWGGNTAVILAPRRRAGVAVLANLGTDRAGVIGRAILASGDASALPMPQRSGRWERPDSYAILFVLLAVAIGGAIALYAMRFIRQLRHGQRHWLPTGWRVARAVLLAALAATLVHSFLRGPGPPIEAFPTTIRQALPVLVSSVLALLLVSGAAGLVPRSRSSGHGPRDR